MLKNTETSYGIVAKSFHWILFFMLTFAVVGGNFLASMPRGADKLEAMSMHKSFGAIILLLILARFAWKLMNPTPKASSDDSPMQETLATGMHWLLYVLMFAQPLSGVLMSQSAGYPVSVFGLFELPTLVNKAQASAEFFQGAHGVIWILLVGSVLGPVNTNSIVTVVAKKPPIKAREAWFGYSK